MRSQEPNYLEDPLEEPETETDQRPVLKRYATPPSPTGWRIEVNMVQGPQTATHPQLTPIRQELTPAQDQTQETITRTELETRMDQTKQSQRVTKGRRERNPRSHARAGQLPLQERDPRNR